MNEIYCKLNNADLINLYLETKFDASILGEMQFMKTKYSRHLDDKKILLTAIEDEIEERSLAFR